ncbi:MAG: TIGR04283 family arsenosugar biosynthesis glycosyltransferase [Acidiferrobacterales bacterium]
MAEERSAAECAVGTGGPTPGVAVIVPVLNEAAGIAERLRALIGAGFREVIVVDGGSDDGTAAQVQTLFDAQASRRRTAGRLILVHSGRGRALQMNRGADVATCEVLLFLHADTGLPPGAEAMVREAIVQGCEWGRFDVCLDSRKPAFRIIERAMNWRSALTGIATGDQALFVRRDVFVMLRGFAPIPLMEDIELSSRLRALAWPARIRVPVVSAVRRWQRGGIARTVLRMWGLRLLYWMGVSPAQLLRFYADVR